VAKIAVNRNVDPYAYQHVAVDFELKMLTDQARRELVSWPTV